MRFMHVANASYIQDKVEMQKNGWIQKLPSETWVSMQQKLKIENWNWKLKLKIEIENWNWKLKLKN